MMYSNDYIKFFSPEKKSFLFLWRNSQSVRFRPSLAKILVEEKMVRFATDKSLQLTMSINSLLGMGLWEINAQIISFVSRMVFLVVTILKRTGAYVLSVLCLLGTSIISEQQKQDFVFLKTITNTTACHGKHYYLFCGLRGSF